MEDDGMYSILQLVVYGSHGVCRILKTEERTVDRKKVEYFVLEPLAQPGTVYLIPSQNPAALAKIRPLLSQEELKGFISMEVTMDTWIPDENRRKQQYRSVLSSGDMQLQMQMLRMLQQYQEQQLQSGKKIHICDDNFLRDVQKVIAGEISAVLEISAKDAMQYLLPL